MLAARDDVEDVSPDRRSRRAAISHDHRRGLLSADFRQGEPGRNRIGNRIFDSGVNSAHLSFTASKDPHVREWTSPAKELRTPRPRHTRRFSIGVGAQRGGVYTASAGEDTIRGGVKLPTSACESSTHRAGDGFGMIKAVD